MTSEIHASREYLLSMSIWYYCIIDPAEVAVPQLLFGRALIKRICDAASAWRRGSAGAAPESNSQTALTAKA